MPAPNNFHDIPNPDNSVVRNNDPTSYYAPENQAAKYRPSGVLFETPVTTIARFATRLIDRVTGKAFSCEELLDMVILKGKASPEAITRTAAEGPPIAYVAEIPATAMTGTYTADTDKTIALTAKILGVLDPAPSLDIVDPAAPNATLAVVDDLETRVVTVTPATDAGDAAVCLVPTDVSNNITVTLSAAGPEGNALYVGSAQVLTANPLGFGDFPDPVHSSPTCVVDGSGNYEVRLANDSGTPGVLTLTESTASGGQLTITQQADVAGAWGNDAVQVIIDLAGASTPFACVATLAEGILTISVTLETDSEAVAVPISDDNLAAAIIAALQLVNGAEDFSGYFAVASATSGNFDSPETASMAGGVDAVFDDTANTAANIATAIAGAAGVASAVADSGTDIIQTTFAPISFTGGGDNAAITSDLDDLATILADSDLIGGVVGVGDGSTLITDSTTTLTGGSDVVPAVEATAASAIGQECITGDAGENKLIHKAVEITPNTVWELIGPAGVIEDPNNPGEFLKHSVDGDGATTYTAYTL